MLMSQIILHMWIGQLSPYSAYIVQSVKGVILRIRAPLTLSIDEVHLCDITIGLGKDTQLAVSTQDNLGDWFKPPVQYVMQILVNKLTTWCAIIEVTKRAVRGMIAFLLNVLRCL